MGRAPLAKNEFSKGWPPEIRGPGGRPQGWPPEIGGPGGGGKGWPAHLSQKLNFLKVGPRKFGGPGGPKGWPAHLSPRVNFRKVGPRQFVGPGERAQRLARAPLAKDYFPKGWPPEIRGPKGWPPEIRGPWGGGRKGWPAHLSQKVNFLKIGPRKFGGAGRAGGQRLAPGN